MPGGVKNAIDYLYNDWIGKPVLIVTYGIHGAQKANASLRTILEGMKLRVVGTSPELKFAEGQEEVFAGELFVFLCYLFSFFLLWRFRTGRLVVGHWCRCQMDADLRYSCRWEYWGEDAEGVG